MSSMQKVILIGYLGADPELKRAGETPLCNLRVATTEKWGKEGARQEHTEWHSVTVWREMAENCARYLSKGRQIYVEGRLQTRSWEDKETKKRVYRTEIIADKIVFLGGPSEEKQTNGGKHRESSYTPPADDVPEWERE